MEDPDDLIAEASGKSHLDVDPECGALLGAEKTERQSGRTVKDCDSEGKKKGNEGMQQC